MYFPKTLFAGSTALALVATAYVHPMTLNTFDTEKTKVTSPDANQLEARAAFDDKASARRSIGRRANNFVGGDGTAFNPFSAVQPIYLPAPGWPANYPDFIPLSVGRGAGGGGAGAGAGAGPSREQQQTVQHLPASGSSRVKKASKKPATHGKPRRSGGGRSSGKPKTGKMSGKPKNGRY